MATALGNSMRVVLRWQLLLTIVAAALALGLLGSSAGLSALLGGGVSVVAGLAYLAMGRLGRAQNAGTALLGVLRAEAVKVLVIVVLLFAVMKIYAGLVPTVFIGTFIVAVLIQSMAFFVRDN